MQLDVSELLRPSPLLIISQVQLLQQDQEIGRFDSQNHSTTLYHGAEYLSSPAPPRSLIPLAVPPKLPLPLLFRPPRDL